MIETDALVIGAGPVGLFQVFQLGLLEIPCHVVDALPYAGGQCVELYGDKPIYDIPSVQVCTGRELTHNLLSQIAPFKARISFQPNRQRSRGKNGRWPICGNHVLGNALCCQGRRHCRRSWRLCPPQIGVAGVEGFRQHIRFFTMLKRPPNLRTSTSSSMGTTIPRWTGRCACVQVTPTDLPTRPQVSPWCTAAMYSAPAPDTVAQFRASTRCQRSIEICSRPAQLPGSTRQDHHWKRCRLFCPTRRRAPTTGTWIRCWCCKAFRQNWALSPTVGAWTWSASQLRVRYRKFCHQ